MRRSTDPQARQATHNRILHAAAGEFARLGFEQANINVIAEQAGLGKGTIYLYFTNKEELFRVMLQTIAQRQLAAARTALGSSNHLRQQLEALFGAFVRLATEDTDGFHVYMSALYGVNRAFQNEAVFLLREYIALIAGVLAQANRGKPLGRAELEARALWVFSATESLVLAAKALGYSEEHLLTQAPLLTELLLHGLQGR